MSMGNVGVCSSPDDAFVAIGSHSGALVVWNTHRGTVAGTVAAGQCLQGVSWSRLGTVAVSDKSGQVSLWA